jgi:hypothetical protein
MRIHLPGDWAASIAFTLAAGILVLMSLSPSAEMRVSAQGLAAVYAGIAIVCTACAIRGRAVKNGSTFFVWSDLGMDASAILFGTGLLYFGGLLLLWPFTGDVALGQILFGLAFGSGFLYFAFLFLLSARIAAFTTDHTIITYWGKPIPFFRHSYQAKDFAELEVQVQRAYAGTYGMITTWQRTYDVVAISQHKKITIGRASTESSARALLKELSTLTGISAHDFPHVEGADTVRSVSA